MPMLLTLASFKSGLSKYVDEFDDSIETDDGSDYDSIASLLDGEDEDLADDSGEDDEREFEENNKEESVE